MKTVNIIIFFFHLSEARNTHRFYLICFFNSALLKTQRGGDEMFLHLIRGCTCQLSHQGAEVCSDMCYL